MNQGLREKSLSPFFFGLYDSFASDLIVLHPTKIDRMDQKPLRSFLTMSHSHATAAQRSAGGRGYLNHRVARIE